MRVQGLTTFPYLDASPVAWSNAPRQNFLVREQFGKRVNKRFGLLATVDSSARGSMARGRAHSRGGFALSRVSNIAQTRRGCINTVILNPSSSQSASS
jgi:hypothetical protein